MSVAEAEGRGRWLRIAGRMASVVIGSGLASALLLLNNVLLARYLAPVSYGDFITASALVNGGMFVGVYGLTQLLLQEYGRRGHFPKDLVGSATLLMSLTTILACGGICLVAALADISDQARLFTYLLWPALAAQATGDVAAVYFQLTRNHWMTGGWFAVLNLLRLGASAAFLLLAASTHWLPISHSIVALGYTAASVTLILLMFRRFGQPRDPADGPRAWAAMPRLLNQASPYAISSLAYFAASQLPVFMFAALAGPQQTATYGVAFLIITTLYFVPQVLMVRYFLLRYYTIAANDRPRLKAIFRYGNAAAAAAGIVVALLCWVLMPLGIRLVFGEKYEESVLVAQIMLLGLPLRFMTVNTSAVVVSSISVWYKNSADLFTAAVAVVAFVLLIRSHGVLGGAVASVITEAAALGSHFYLARRYVLR